MEISPGWRGPHQTAGKDEIWTSEMHQSNKRLFFGFEETWWVFKRVPTVLFVVLLFVVVFCLFALSIMNKIA